MAAFGFYYKGFVAEYELHEIEKEKERLAIIAAEDAQQAEAERRAKEDADRRTAEREATEAAKIAKRDAEWAATGKEIADDTAKYSSEAAKFAQEKADLELSLLDVRNKHQKLTTESYELMKEVELARIAKRTAELKEQRMVEMVANRAKQSAMAQMPPPPPMPSK